MDVLSLLWTFKKMCYGTCALFHKKHSSNSPGSWECIHTHIWMHFSIASIYVFVVSVCMNFIIQSVFPYLYPVLIIWKAWWQASLLNQTVWICFLCRMLNDIPFRLVCTWEENKAFNSTKTVKFVWSACPVFCAFVNGFGSFTGYFYAHI
jgi:hypothetical protein